MDLVTLLLIIVGLVVIGFGSFVAVQRRRRSGGVIAAKPRRSRGRR